MDAEFEAPESSVAVTKIEKLEGDAEVRDNHRNRFT